MLRAMQFGVLFGRGGCWLCLFGDAVRALVGVPLKCSMLSGVYAGAS